MEGHFNFRRCPLLEKKPGRCLSDLLKGMSIRKTDKGKILIRAESTPGLFQRSAGRDLQPIQRNPFGNKAQLAKETECLTVDMGGDGDSLQSFHEGDDLLKWKERRSDQHLIVMPYRFRLLIDQDLGPEDILFILAGKMLINPAL